MTISIDLPPDVEQSLRQLGDNLDQTIKEACLVELFRQGKITHSQLGNALGLSRMETDGLLKEHEVYYDITAEDVVRESDQLRKLREENARRS